jgi:hypothetical protein
VVAVVVLDLLGFFLFAGYGGLGYLTKSTMADEPTNHLP